jgi:ketosteroid isomerase-like protein
VENGGTLVLLANDTSNCDISHVNKLAAEFGIHFSDKSGNMVKNNQFEQGAVEVPSGHPIFQSSHKLYIKELSVLQVQAPAQASLTKGDDVIMATANVGKGRVFALGDPWLYNEYVDGKKLPADFDNFKAAQDLAKWLLVPTKPLSKTEKQVAEAVEKLRLAMVSGDKNALEQITTEGLSYGHSGGKIEDRNSFVEALSSGRSDFVDIALSDQTIAVSGNTAIVRHRLTANTNDAGKGPATIHLGIMLVWVKQQGSWKLLARQAVKI